uniref:Amine oxidase domain-containing protein n=1 Tax=Eutreptiella gymnastica TaxID=73025 RepID=A0A7S1NEM6_9EUGL
MQSGSIAFEPALPPGKVRSIHRVGMGLMDKVLVRFAECFWDPSMGRWGYTCDERGKWHLVLCDSENCILECVVGADFAWQMEGMTDEAVLEDLCTYLRRAFTGDQPLPPIEGHFISRWGMDPYTRGAYSYLKVGCSPSDFEVLAEPVGSLFFAGEHTNKEDYASAHGAFISGEWAADAISQYLQQECGEDRGKGQA